MTTEKTESTDTKPDAAKVMTHRELYTAIVKETGGLDLAARLMTAHVLNNPDGLQGPPSEDFYRDRAVAEARRNQLLLVSEIERLEGENKNLRHEVARFEWADIQRKGLKPMVKPDPRVYVQTRVQPPNARWSRRGRYGTRAVSVGKRVGQ